MTTATGTPLFHALAARWRALAPHALSVEQIADDWGTSTDETLNTLQQLATDHLAFELPTQAGRWRRAWPRFVCLPDAADPLPNYASYGTSPSMALNRWGHDHLPALASEQLVDVNDGIAVAIYHCMPVIEGAADMPVMQLGVVGSMDKREVLIWEGCSYCGGTAQDPDNLTGQEPLPCPACAMEDDVVMDELAEAEEAIA